MSRIVDQYAAAIRQYKQGQPAAYDDLPKPPGFPPLPVPEAAPQQAPTASPAAATAAAAPRSRRARSSRPWSN